MLRVNKLPGSLAELLEEFRPCFTAPTFTTFAMLAAGLIARPAGRTVCGMLAGAGPGGVWHHSRAHRFFAAAAWSADAVGLVVLRLAAGWLIPAGAPVVIAVDDTMFRRAGRKVHAVHWAYDGSLKVPKGGKKISRGNTFVIAAVIAELPFLRRPAALPAAARLWRRGGPPRTALARELTGLIAAAPACRGRIVHVAADTAYICTELRGLPAGVTLTGPLPRHASLYEVHPELDYPPARGRRRGRPRTRGARIGTPAQLAAAGPGRTALVTRYGEVAISDAKNITGAGEARNRRPRAVERTVPFALFTQSIVVIWYHLAGHSPASARDRRGRAPWYAAKTCPAYIDMITRLRRVLIAAQFHPGVPRQPTPEEIHAVRLAWAQAAA